MGKGLSERDGEDFQSDFQVSASGKTACALRQVTPLLPKNCPHHDMCHAMMDMLIPAH